MKPCLVCSMRPRLTTDGHGHVVDITPPCTHVKPRIVCNKARRDAGICQRCSAPVDGMVKRALYCAAHRKVRKQESTIAFTKRTDGEAQKRYRKRNKIKLRRQAMDGYRKRGPEANRKASARWAKNNPDKIKAKTAREIKSGQSREWQRQQRARKNAEQAAA